jgi:uncharacterized protein YkwD
MYGYKINDEHIDYDYVLPTDNELYGSLYRDALDGVRTAYTEEFGQDWWICATEYLRQWDDPEPHEMWQSVPFTKWLCGFMQVAYGQVFGKNEVLDPHHCMAASFETYMVDYSSSSSSSFSCSCSSSSSTSFWSISSSYSSSTSSSSSSTSKWSSSSSSESSSSSSYAGERFLQTEAFIKRLNAYRAAADIHNVVHNEMLTEAARRHAEDMAENEHFEHYGTDGSSPEDRIRQSLYTYGSETWVIGENIAYGAISEEEAFDLWRDSPPHNEAMLDDRFFEVGLWFTINSTSGVIYWCLTFGQHLENKCTIER